MAGFIVAVRYASKCGIKSLGSGENLSNRMPSLFEQVEQMVDVCAKYHKGNPQSKEANLAIAPHKASIRERILAYIEEQGERGATSYEVEQALGLRHQTCAARLAELKRDGLVVPTGVTRKTDSGCQAMVVKRNFGSSYWKRSLSAGGRRRDDG